MTLALVFLFILAVLAIFALWGIALSFVELAEKYGKLTGDYQRALDLIGQIGLENGYDSGQELAGTIEGDGSGA